MATKARFILSYALRYTALTLHQQRFIAMRRLITSIVLLFFLAACGQKGALYLPEKNTNKNTNATHNGQPKHDASFY